MLILASKSTQSLATKVVIARIISLLTNIEESGHDFVGCFKKYANRKTKITPLFFGYFGR